MKINTRLETTKELKAALKEAAVAIRVKKSKRKSRPHGRVAGLDSLRFEVRHHHVAYCLLRGKTIEQIEPKHDKENNPRDNDYIERIMAPVEKHWESLQKELEVNA